MKHWKRRTRWIAAAVAALVVVGGGVTTAALIGAAGEQSAAAPQGTIHADTRMGAVELRAADLDGMTAYYGPDGLGLDVLAESDGEVSLGADGEALIRLVAGTGARPDTLGLGSLAVVLPDDVALTAVETRLTDAGLTFERAGVGIVVADPWGTRVELTVEEPAAG